MKRKFNVSTFLISTIFVGILSSCSKDQVDVPNNEPNNESVNVNRAPFVLQTGSLSGKINPVGLKAKITLVDGTGRIQGPYYADLSTGAFRTSEILTGVYKLVIEYPGAGPSDAVDATYSISTYTQEVTVTANSNTDLGVIYLN
jgi:hypothetical protein